MEIREGFWYRLPDLLYEELISQLGLFQADAFVRCKSLLQESLIIASQRAQLESKLRKLEKARDAIHQFNKTDIPGSSKKPDGAAGTFNWKLPNPTNNVYPRIKYNRRVRPDDLNPSK